jgi:raffinose/stachyose/melibiose transport system substrate-binding protein
VVPSRSKNKALAYDFIDLTLKPEIQQVLGNGGGVPVAADPKAITDPKNQELIAAFNAISSQDGLAFYPDWPVPGYYDVLVAGVQELINGSKSPSDVLDEIAKPYQEHVAGLAKPGK